MKKSFLNNLSKIYLVIGIFLIFCGFILLGITFYPNIWYSIDDSATDNDILSIQKEIEILEEKEKEDIKKEVEIVDNRPPINPSLPTTPMLKINNIGVDGEIHQGENAKVELDKGIWIVPRYGTPDNNELPIIIAAHRFGYVYWSSEFRTKSSFYNLPKLKVGDRVQIVWDQREYQYEIYKAEDDKQITDYDADLILYTCRMYNSPIRVFRYLRRIK